MGKLISHSEATLKHRGKQAFTKLLDRRARQVMCKRGEDCTHCPGECPWREERRGRDTITIRELLDVLHGLAERTDINIEEVYDYDVWVRIGNQHVPVLRIDGDWDEGEIELVGGK